MPDNLTFEWDEDKRQSNLQTHGVDFADAHLLDWNTTLQINQTHTNELRHLTYAPMDDRLYAIVWTERDDKIRIISFRKANNREISSYEKA